MNQFKKSYSTRGRHYPVWLSCVLALMLGYWAQAAQADQSQKYQYHYTLLWWSALPEADQFVPTAIDDRGRVYGSYNYAASLSVTHVAVYVNGAITVLQPGNTGLGTVNARGTIGGSVYTDPVSFKTQAALFRGNSVKLIPSQPGETDFQVISLNDFDTALVSSGSEDLTYGAYRLYNKGKILFSYQSPQPAGIWGVNNLGTVSGAIFNPSLNAYRAIRFQPPYRKPQFLAPLQSDNYSSSYGINNLGYVLGLSQNIPLLNDDKKHYGLWDLKGNFKTYFEDTTDYLARFNDNNLIVLTEGGDFQNSYLVPKPGVRFNLMDLVDNPTEVKGYFSQILDINNRGDMVGVGSDPNGDVASFVLRRVLPVH